MHPFFGIQNVQNDRDSPARDATFLADLVDAVLGFEDVFVHAQEARPAGMVHAYMLRTTPELRQRTPLQPQFE